MRTTVVGGSDTPSSNCQNVEEDNKRRVESYGRGSKTF